ncbi:hypothetical protein Salat_1694400 [Sesamum alatum]|uniref:Uncharacterized protein n=1 Tax=Sesamum alatum TaxID=300844 RepID=A0AAE1Y8G5_9LAMI|nr:hypothetical protein Salat_1694400 [Sesamum alatum]
MAEVTHSIQELRKMFTAGQIEANKNVYHVQARDVVIPQIQPAMGGDPVVLQRLDALTTYGMVGVLGADRVWSTIVVGVSGFESCEATTTIAGFHGAGIEGRATAVLGFQGWKSRGGVVAGYLSSPTWWGLQVAFAVS